MKINSKDLLSMLWYCFTGIFFLPASLSFCLSKVPDSIVVIDDREKKSVSKNGMKVSWFFTNDRINIEMSAPTSGWITVGFNSRDNIEGAYLLMGRVVHDKSEVVEHYTLRAREYRSLSSLGQRPNVQIDSGVENEQGTHIIFSVPTQARNHYQMDLSPSSKLYMIIAYSQEDDFQHHSVMRTHIPIEL